MKKPATNPTLFSIGKQTTESSVVTRLSPDRKVRKQAIQPVIDRSAERAIRSIDMGELETAIQESPTINTSKIVDIHNRIIAGEYKIDAQRLAEKVIELESILDFH